MAYPRSFIDEVRRSSDPLQIIGEVVALRRRGTRWVGLCPFHDEKTPSFTVSEEGLWHCFGCGAGGDLFSFVMEQEALGFSEAVVSLAERSGIPVPQQQAASPRADGRKQIDRRRLMEVLAAAAGFYRQQLAGSEGGLAREFLASRGFEEELVSRFGVGYAPDAWESLGPNLSVAGFVERELEVAGLVKKRDSGSGTYDRLRRRVVFPIRDLRGRPIAFGGRVIDSGEPKYLNSPETPTFTKSRTLYGLFEGRDAILATGFALLVEGYFDVLACAQYGLQNAVAPLGTSFTEEHAKLLARFTQKAVVGFDGDTAGQAAAERTVGVFLGQGFQVNVVRFPAEHDPDSFLRAAGIESFREALQRSDSGLDFLVQRAGERTNLSTPRGKAEALSSLLEFVVPIGDRVERAEWIGRVAERLAVDVHLVEGAATEVMTRARRRPEARSRPAAGRDSSAWRADLDKVPLAEKELLRAVLQHAEWRRPLEEICEREAIRDPRIRALLVAVEACQEDGAEVEVGTLLSRCDEPGVEALLSRLLVEDAASIDWDSARNCALGIHDDSLRRRLKEMTKDIQEALEAGDRERFSKLNREKVSLAHRIGSG